jgi:signal peptidase I
MNQRAWTVIAAFLGLGALGGTAFLLATRRLVVEGRSMVPAYGPGDRVLVNKLAYLRARPSVGDVVVVRQPGSGMREDIKRIAAGPGEMVEVRGEQVALGPDEWFVLGDNADESTDSRQLGPVRSRDIVGKVVTKY